MMDALSCLLCKSSALPYLHSDVSFHRCANCQLIFKHPKHFLSQKEERHRYEQHNNEDTPAYRKFLNQLAAPVQFRVKTGSRGLDFGCGPVPVLSGMLEEQGYPMAHYDPYFFNYKHILNDRFEFITCSEVVEHMYQPSREFSQLFSMLSDSGQLFVRTEAPPDDFANWWYHRDPTHVAFYSRETMEWLARRYQMRCQHLSHSVSVFSKDLDSLNF